MSRLGYQPDYLGNRFRFDVPEVSFEHGRDIVQLEDGSASLDYLNYSVVLNRRNPTGVLFGGKCGFLEQQRRRAFVQTRAC